MTGVDERVILEAARLTLVRLERASRLADLVTLHIELRVGRELLAHPVAQRARDEQPWLFMRELLETCRGFERWPTTVDEVEIALRERLGQARERLTGTERDVVASMIG